MTKSSDSETDSPSGISSVNDIFRQFLVGYMQETVVDDSPELGISENVVKDFLVALVCVVALWLLFSDNNVSERIPACMLGLSLSYYFVKNLLPSETNVSKKASPSPATETQDIAEDSSSSGGSSLIFISYSRQDQEYVKKLILEFERRGLSIWLDDRIDYGSAWPRVIEEHLEKCQAFVLVMTSSSRESHWVTCELNCALELKKPIFPILLEGKRWLDVAAIQTFDVEQDAIPPERFFDMFSMLNE